MTPLMRPEYLRVKLTNIPAKIINEYKLRKKVNKNGFVFIEVTKGKYGLPQAGLFANLLLEKKTQQTRLLPKQASPEPLAPQHAKNTVHLGRQ